MAGVPADHHQVSWTSLTPFLSPTFKPLHHRADAQVLSFAVPYRQALEGCKHDEGGAWVAGCDDEGCVPQQRVNGNLPRVPRPSAMCSYITRGSVFAADGYALSLGLPSPSPAPAQQT
ncbi:hypothetical protein E2542_SST02529 [Spatholobus suberectus]|nr:hypothetical protein E2542_SST02529 [Spatholobus suberectus]